VTRVPTKAPKLLKVSK